MSTFIPGIELNRRFYEEAVRPLLSQHFPALSYAAALIGPGSDVLGFDTAMSMDHDWGPRLLIFLREQDTALIPSLDKILRTHLPHSFAGFPVNVMEAADEPGITQMQQTTKGEVNHRISLQTLQGFLQYRLAYGGEQPPTVADWLTFPSQELRSLTAGVVYHDEIGELTALRAQLAWYPHDVWLYLLACGWQRIGQEEHLMPRAGFAGDELGSALIGSRLVRDIMFLCFLLEKHYAPYPKWFGTAFKQLDGATALQPILWRAERAASWQERESALCEAYTQLAHMHNATGITHAMPETVSSFHDRPFRVIQGETFARALLEQITDPNVQRLRTRPLIGSIDHFSDSTDLHAIGHWRAVLRELYE
ncbi:hypothetical protein KSF_070580 [Reticulibacter mediterranei]|uniref:DUF4037 domain-containing protein n=1 Tax=Reticulibacter mediterranei TaxID=2778369 RepID=A0A8J3IR60_9CHLR|nr:DUF4037 domain-containing protein [Reticulibacter mediterranei]GHO97010.1 hypothetical protein KSF_070580 [Reticulibacter mediterranei]